MNEQYKQLQMTAATTTKQQVQPCTHTDIIALMANEQFAGFRFLITQITPSASTTIFGNQRMYMLGGFATAFIEACSTLIVCAARNAICAEMIHNNR